MVQFLFYSPGQQQLTLTYMPNSTAGEFMPGGSADPNDERALPVNFVDLPAAVAKLRAKGMRGVHVKSAHLENYGRGSYVGGGIGVFGPEWDIKSALDEEGVVLAELPDQNDARLASNEGYEGGQAANLIHVDIEGLRSNRGQVYCQIFQSARNFPSNSDGNVPTTASTIRNRRAACDFQNVEPGSYAVLVFHDEDSTHLLELNPDGTPHEGVGLSNNPSAAAGLPSYAAAKFTYRMGTMNLTIDMKYPAGQAPDATQLLCQRRRQRQPDRVRVCRRLGDSTRVASETSAGTKIYPPSSTIAGTDGCPTTRYHTDGMIVAVIDYQGRPTAASLAVTRHPATGGQFQNAPYYLDLDPGRTLQFLGPIFENGSYDIRFQYDYSLARQKALRKFRVGTELSDSLTPTGLRRRVDGDGCKRAAAGTTRCVQHSLRSDNRLMVVERADCVQQKRAEATG